MSINIRTMSSYSEQHDGLSSGESTNAIAVKSTRNKSEIKRMLLASTKAFQKKFAQFRLQVSSELFSGEEQLCTSLKDLRMDLLSMEKEVAELNLQEFTDLYVNENCESTLNTAETASNHSSSIRNTPDRSSFSPRVEIKRNIFTGAVTTQILKQTYPEPQYEFDAAKKSDVSFGNHPGQSFAPLDQSEWTLKERVTHIEKYLGNNDMNALSSEFARMQVSVQDLSTEILPGCQQYKPTTLFSK